MMLTNKNIVKKGSVLLSVKFVASALTLLFHYLLAKQLSAVQFGLFSLAMTCLLFTSVFAKQGLEQVALKFISISSQESMAKWYFIFVTCVLTSASIIALLLFFLAEPLSVSLFNQPKLIPLISLIAILTIIQAVLAINTSALKAKEHTTSALLLSGFITFSLTILTLIIYPVSSAYDALLYFLCSAVVAIVVSFIIIFIKFHLAFSLMKKTSISELKGDVFDVSQVSKNLFIISLMALATSQVSILILSSYVSLATLGSYSLAVKLSLLLSYPLIVINAITASRYAKLYQQNKVIEFRQLAFNTTKGLLILGTVGAFILYFSVDFILEYIGKSYIGAALIVKILLVGQWFNLATGSVVSMLIMSGYERLHRRNTLILTSINVAALVIFIPLYGVISAAIITSLAMAIKNMTSLYYVNKYIYQVDKFEEGKSN